MPQHSDRGDECRRGWGLFTQTQTCDVADVTAFWHGTWEPLEHARKGELPAAKTHLTKISAVQRAALNPKQGMLAKEKGEETFRAIASPI